ncbi:MAG: DsbE family thiol:disulfide interchange protein [Rhodospirillales bacterium]|jgi:cytochrome c biogenesis protein CcmG/thiol:disulfide interchange protein DsbE|nr:DsbE family thiol:disulfide interchange protein [Rhodospirillales bacterium]MDP6643958.1 DsbE family thiol:disulfide interchange protein [Rhodospirillales bacterium]MDP6841085.1 DsbE family thiol:disulfide interchange protein [Rhodospirillales bacterium]|tara:strand:+ start:589 stop:1128 length:540 start_codon:yes stop_codon:yes gene_type:complete
MIKRLAFLAPILVLAILAIYFTLGLKRDPSKLPSVLINQPVPEFSLPPIEGSARGFSSNDLKGKVTLVNIFGSWCYACLAEHPFLMKLTREKIIPVYGIDWREKDRTAGPRWLKKHGNPYLLIGDDPNSRGAIAFGVSGAPESFIVDQAGIIRYKHIGVLNDTNWSQTLFPIIKKLRQQ